MTEITRDEGKEAYIKWEKTIIVKLLRKRIDLSLLKARLSRLWKDGELEVKDLEHNFFIVRFSNWEDYGRVSDGSPWVNMGLFGGSEGVTIILSGEGRAE